MRGGGDGGDVYVYEVGSPYLHPEELPPGDSFGVHHFPGVGLHFLCALHGVRDHERDGFQAGRVRVTVGSGVHPLTVVAWRFEGFGWSDGPLALLDVPGRDPEEYRTAAARMQAGGRAREHVIVSALLVDRDRGDEVAAARAFTLSPHVSEHLGALLVRTYEHRLTEELYAERVRAWQARWSDTAEWVRDRAVASCWAGD